MSSKGGGSSRGSKSSRRSRKKKETVNDFQMFVMDAETNEYITPEKVEARAAPKRFVLVVRQGQKFKVKVKIFPGAWDHRVNAYQWYHVELLIDGQHISRRFLKKEPGDQELTYTFEEDPCGRQFIFDTRHDGNQGPAEHIDDEDEVGQIVVRFRRARSLPMYDYNRPKRRRFNHDYHEKSQFQLREARKVHMDIQTKEKKSTMRCVFGEARRQAGSWGRGGGRGPPAQIVDEDDVVAECSTMYDSADAFELRNWINPLHNERFRRYFPNRDFEEELRIYNLNQRKSSEFCDLTDDNPKWLGFVKQEVL